MPCLIVLLMCPLRLIGVLFYNVDEEEGYDYEEVVDFFTGIVFIGGLLSR